MVETTSTSTGMQNREWPRWEIEQQHLPCLPHFFSFGTWVLGWQEASRWCWTWRKRCFKSFWLLLVTEEGPATLGTLLISHRFSRRLWTRRRETTASSSSYLLPFLLPLPKLSSERWYRILKPKPYINQEEDRGRGTMAKEKEEGEKGRKKHRWCRKRSMAEEEEVEEKRSTWNQQCKTGGKQCGATIDGLWALHV